MSMTISVTANIAVAAKLTPHIAVIGFGTSSANEVLRHFSAASVVTAIAFAAISQNSNCEKPENSAVSKNT